MPGRSLPSLLFLAIACCSGVAARAASFRVGGDAACDFPTIQPALDAAVASAGRDFVLIAGNASYTAQALRLQGQDVDLVGGFATCASASPTPGVRTTISGAGGAADSVLVVLGDGNRALSNLTITGGDETDGGTGGGIDFEGTGTMTLTRVTVSQNRAGYGGGISFEGSDEAILTLANDVVVQNNVASGSGGGIRLAGNSVMLMRSAGSTITGNEALGTLPDSGYGGGIEILGASKAQIASGGIGNSGAVSFNRAKYGGGIGMPGTESDPDFTLSIALLFTTDPQRPGRINDNVATIAGGGVYGGVLYDFDDRNESALCAYDFRIDHNRAPEGAAVYFLSDRKLGITSAGKARLNAPDSFYCGVSTLPLPAPSVACASGVACNIVDGNAAQQPNGQPAPGAVLFLDQGTELDANRVAFVGNAGNDLVLQRPNPEDDRPIVDFDACLFAGNTLGARVIATDTGSLRNSTIAGNAVGFSSALLMSQTAVITDSIVWQPGTIALDATRGSVTGGFVLTNDPASLPELGNTVTDRFPRFVDAARGDYRLRAGSPAVDAAPAVPGDAGDLDLDGRTRDVDLSLPINGAGPRDIGAFERQSVAPLVLNDTFEGDLNQWAEATAGVTAFDADNFVGGAGSGSLKIDWNNSPVVSSRVTGRVQCVHLPGPGTYRLTAAAHTSGSLPPVNVQTAALAWEFRRDGGEACNTGAPERSADFNITTGLPWVLPATPTTIVVSPAEWTAMSSISVTTVVKASGVTAPPRLQAWFDGVQLTVDVTGPVPLVFASGFE